MQLTNVPVGTVLPYLGNSAPYGFLVCNGRELLINHYQELFSVIGVTFGGDGVETFRLPSVLGIGSIASFSYLSLRRSGSNPVMPLTIIKH